MINLEQTDIIKTRASRFSQTFLDEVGRLINTGGVGKDTYGNYPLSDIFKVALENIAYKERITNPSVYTNLKKF